MVNTGLLREPVEAEKNVQSTHAMYIRQALLKKDQPGAGEMTQWLGVLSTFPEDLGSIPSTYMSAHNHL